MWTKCESNNLGQVLLLVVPLAIVKAKCLRVFFNFMFSRSFLVNSSKFATYSVGMFLPIKELQGCVELGASRNVKN